MAVCMSMTAAKTKCMHWPSVMGGLGSSMFSSSLVVVVIFVDHRFFLCWSRCPLVVAIHLGRCLWMAVIVRLGQVMKWPLDMALSQVETAGLKQTAWRNCISSAWLDVFLA